MLFIIKQKMQNIKYNNAPKFYVNYVNSFILKLIKKINKKLNSSHYRKIVPSTNYTILQIVDMIISLIMNLKYIYSIDQVQKHKKFAFALYNLVSLYI